MLPHQANLGGHVHGGEIFKLMDMAGGAVCQQYANTVIVTARVDEMQFTAPVLVGDCVSCKARIICVGKTSMDVLITVDAESLKTGEGPRRVASALSTHVSIGGDGRPKKVEPLVLESEEQRRLFALAQERRAERRGPLG
jgi:acyl-CoA hydrolase